uniref:WD repeat-containing protein 44 n=1 Tax=Cajanus cajan TaxID=3821 RepID=A0A151RY63_CAJCA|nr:WD repeat-containing protein 44 [Cajanus cajan]
MERRKTMTMNWAGLGGDDDDEHFFESNNRLSTAVPYDLASSSDEEEDFEDSRLSFASTMSSVQSIKPRMSNFTANFTAKPNYDVWMAAPGSITERRRQLLGSMGLDDNKELLQATSAAIARAITRNIANKTMNKNPTIRIDKQKTKAPRTAPVFVLVRSRSEGDIDSFSMEKARKDDLIGKISKQRLTRTATEVTRRKHSCAEKKRIVVKDVSGDSTQSNRQLTTPVVSSVGAFFLIKNLDTGKEFIVNEYGEDGAWNRLSDLQTGKQLTMEEFERTVGHSAVVKEAMRRANRNDKKLSSNSYISKSLRLSKRRGASLLKNIKGVASGFVGEPPEGQNEWVRVRQTGKSQKELSALHLCQEFQAHEGCVWTLKFSLDGKYLASAGEDKAIHVWEVQECEVMPMRPEEGNAAPSPIHPSLLKKGKSGSKRGGAIPDFVHVPETVFSLSDKPFCSFNGHLDEVLDLSWNKSQQLLSSSMDKTVRLWDLETKTCVKFFAHNDYVTCVQFNPMDEDYFITGSLDAKVRMWNISARLVVDWTDIHEMVTAVAHTPDGQGVLVGTQKGNCRSYTIEDYKLSQSGTIEVRSKKTAQLKKKVNGFQFAPNNPSEVLITSADCRIRIVEDSQVVQKYKGFRNTSSQITAAFTPNGRYIICASEDSQVYVWKHEESRSAGPGKAKTVLINQAHEHFPCKDVSVAIPWPGTVRGDPPPMPGPNPKKNNPKPVKDQDTASGSPSKRMLPPLPKKSNNNAIESSPDSPDNSDPAAISHTESGIGDSLGNSDSFASGSSSLRYGDSASISAAASPSTSSMSSNYSSNDGCNGASAMHPSAWGLVIVTAGFGGEIRCYQNFGLPRRVRQTNLFMGPS